MSYGIKRILTAAMLILSLSGCKEEGVVLPTSTGPQGWYVDPRLDNLWIDIKANQEGFDTQQYFEFLLQACAYDWDQQYLKVALTNATNAQIRTEGHINYGQIPRMLGDDTETDSFDQNNIEFAMEFGGLVRALYYDKLDAENKALLDDFIDYAVYAILAHDNVCISYTNIYLMRMWNLIVLGENLSSDRTWGRSMAVTPAQLAEQGYQMFRTWMAEIKRNGIHEHNSPTYTGVQAECLGYIAKYTKDETIRKEANIALEYFSAMLFTNYFRTSMSLAGVQSRCYYRGSSYGKIDNIAGGLVKGYGTYYFNKLAMWEPTDQARALNMTYPRLVCYKWGEDADMNAVAYYHEKYVIGSAGRPYTGNANEKNLTVFLASDRIKSLVNVAHYLEGRSDPYGKKKVGSLARHLQKYAMGRAQRNNEFVVMMAGDGSERGDTEKMCSHIIVPATNVDEIWIGNTQVKDWLSVSSQSLNAEDKYTFFLRFEDVVVAIRYLLVEDVAGKTVTPVFMSDTDGSSSFTQGTAMRITSQLSSSTPVKWSMGRVAMWWRVEDGITTDEQFAAMRQSVIDAECRVNATSDNFEVLVKSPDGDLGFSGNYCRKVYKQYVFATPEVNDPNEYWAFEQTETVGGIDAENHFFTVNGQEIAEPIFSKSNL